VNYSVDESATGWAVRKATGWAVRKVNPSEIGMGDYSAAATVLLLVCQKERNLESVMGAP
jgi:hypothetical protein